MYQDDHIVIQNFDHRHQLPEEPKTVVINSSGGSDNYATPVYDWIRLHSVDTVAEGSCQSFGFTVFTAGRKRFSLPSTNFMLHGPVVNGDSKTWKQRKSKKRMLEMHMNNFDARWLDRMVEISNKPREFWSDMCKHPDEKYYFTAQQMKEMGVVTHIIGEDN